MSVQRRDASAFKHAPCPMAIVDAGDGTVMAVNRAMCTALDTPLHRLIGQVWPVPIGGQRSDLVSMLERVVPGETLVVEGALGAPIDAVWWRQQVSLVSEPGRRPYLVVAVEDRTAEHRVTRELATAAHRDELTGLWNRRRFRSELRRLLSDRSGPWVGVALFDVDDFKSVNDTYGHAMGDAALVAVASAIGAAVPRGSMVARLSGDEFAAAIIAPSAQDVEARCRSLLQQVTTVSVGPAMPDLNLSTGVAVAEPGPEADRRVQELMVRADVDMYAFKTRARAERHRSFGPDEHHGDVVDAWSHPGDGEPRATGSDDDTVVELWSHPVVSVASGQPVQHDVVLRPADALVTFDTLISVLKMVERHTRRRLGQPQRHLIHVPNLPLGAGAAAAWLSRAADDLGLERSHITFAMDEMVLLGGDEGALAGLKALQAEGFAVAVDRFGARFGSLRLLGDLEADQVWLDARLFDPAAPGSAPNGAALVASVLGLTARMGSRTGVAGVTEASLTRLASLGIDLALVPDETAGRPLGVVSGAANTAPTMGRAAPAALGVRVS